MSVFLLVMRQNVGSEATWIFVPIKINQTKAMKRNDAAK